MLFREDKRNAGKLAEKGAARFLENQGLRIIERNYSCRAGEIDIIASDGLYLVFTEVRFRAGSQFGTGSETVDRHKQKKIIMAARHYLGSHKLDCDCRFDVIEATGSPMTFCWLKDAFEEQAWTWN